MVTSIGLDLVEVARIGLDLKRFSPRFESRILGPEEMQIFNHRRDAAIFLAGRFAAKEAVIKALGDYLTKRPRLTDLQIINDSTGRPQLVMPDEILSQVPGARCLLSITHDKNYAAAVAVFVEEK